jgi:S1-C subfamily serine protease
MKSQGYDVTGSPSILFDAEEDDARTLYWIGARITDIKMDVCQRTTLLFAYDLGYTGEGSMEVEWTVYDRLKRESVYKTTTRGYSRMDLPNYEAIGLMLDDSFAAAAHYLGADEKFHNLVIRGLRPGGKAATGKVESVYGPVTQFDPRGAVALVRQALRAKTMTPDDLETLRRTAVQVATGSGHGSGFFISDQGHILTNSHVVGDADRVRIVTADKEYKLTGEVLRRDAGRDVALVRIEDMPAGLKPVVLPLRREFPKVGEEIYAIGSPAIEKLQDTVTKGIVSAIREPTRSSPYNYIQGDVFIHGGNSGGPLLDERGNIIGITVAGYGDSGLDLNLFIPIGDALKKLDIGQEESPLHLVP